MKRRVLILFWAILSILAGCSKELHPVGLTFSAETECFDLSESSTKTELSDNGASGFHISWVNGDRVRINEYCYTAENASGGTASFVSDELDAPSPTFCACYPYSIARWSESEKTMSIVLPDVQEEPSSGLVVSGFPMYAESEGNSLKFKNLCGLLRLDLKAASGSLKVTSIKLKSNNLSLSGECEIKSSGLDEWFAYPTGSQLVPAGLTYTCNRIVDTSGESFYIYLPPGDYQGFDIVVETDCGSVHRTAKTGTIVRIYRSRVSKIPLTLDPVYAGHDYVDLGLPSHLKWATMNVGAASVTGTGAYFLWSEASASFWGGAWRVPTNSDFEELFTNTYWQWTDSYNSTGIKGFVVYKTKKDEDKNKINGADGYSLVDTHIFLPTLDSSSKEGSYWSSSEVDKDNAYQLYFKSSSWREMKSLEKAYDLNVRPVCP